MMTDKEFSLRLAKLRTQKGVSARDMSLSMGQNPGYINNIETGKSMPSLSGFFYICDYLDITARDFFDDGNEYPEQLCAVFQDMQKLEYGRYIGAGRQSYSNGCSGSAAQILSFHCAQKRYSSKRTYSSCLRKNRLLYVCGEFS